ncbi:hypothetical protein C8R43DRAFT_905275, partial [Mycena crocata]
MPIWYHAKSNAWRNVFNLGPAVKCLRKNHKVRLVGEAETLARRLGAARHVARRDCKCCACKDTRRECRPRRCANPHQCYLRAREMMDLLQNKWNPMHAQPEDYEDGQFEADENGDPEMVEFNPLVTVKGTISDTFRIF